MVNLESKIKAQEIYTTICDYLPKDHSSPQSLHNYIEQIIKTRKYLRVLDLGCGEGLSINLFRKMSTNIDWYGVDIEDSPEAKQRNIKENISISTFNGVNLPYTDNCFDLIFCQQVLEHVRHPDALIADALRVLKPNGLFAGSVSYLEPYHSYSIFNFTPYGIIKVFCDAGFELQEMRPEVDASALINRQLFNRSKLLKPIWQCNFLYTIIEFIGKIFSLGHRERNFLKIQFSGHIIFLAKKAVTI